MAIRKGSTDVRLKRRKAGNAGARISSAHTNAKSPRAGLKNTPPKLTPPRPTRLFPRERLFDLLDRTREDHRVIWVSAPGGAGKTSLATSYLASRKLPKLWYQVDPGDGDIASFFYYIGLAARRAAPRFKKPLPLLTPEYLADIPTFTRNFFRELYRRLPQGLVIVLDNYQDAPEDSQLHDVLHTAMQEVPGDKNLLVLSRVEPPSVLARLRLCDHAACIDWGKMQLTPEETAGIGVVRMGSNSLDSKTLVALHERAHGWAAGVVLMLEQNKRGVPLDANQTPSDQKLLFGYFANEFLARAEPMVQEFLLKTALFPKITVAAAEALTDTAESQAILDDLTRRNYFTVRHAGTNKDSYEYHPLFREFLLTQLHNLMSPVELVRLRHRGARLLEKAGSLEEAVDLYRLAYDWGAMTRLILTSAPALLQQSRHQTLARWIGQLPAAVVEQEPWLIYWRGLCRVLFAPAEARHDLERAYAMFDTRNDAAGMYLSWATIIDSFLIEWTNFTPMDKWIAAFESLRVRHPRFPSPEIEARAVFAVIGVLSYLRPDHPELPAWVARAEQLLHSITDVNQRILSGMILHLYYVWLGRYDRAAEFGALLPANADVEPQCRIIQLMLQATSQWCFGDPRASFSLVEEGWRIIESYGLQFWKYLIWAQGVYAGCACGDLESASRYLEQMSPLAAGRGRVDVALFHHLASMVAWHRRDLSSAATHAKTSLRIAEEIGQVFAEASCQFMVAILSFAQGESEKAALHLTATRRLGERMCSPWIAYMCHMGEAYFSFQEGRHEQSLQFLRLALAMSRERGTPSLPWMPHAVLARLYAMALVHDIESDQVRALIRKFGIAPDDNACLPDTWPFPLKLYTLGRFSVLVDNKPLRFSGKSQKKPLELLKALVALGGREVSEAKLAEALWPEADGDTASQSLATTLHRLRKLIGEETIERQEGRLGLDSRCVWVDAWAFERSLAELEHACQKAEPEKLRHLTARLFTLYRGPFLKDEPDASWLLNMRERLRGKLLRGLEAAARCLEQAQQHEQAVVCYQKTLEIEPLAEGLYRGLMRTHLAQGHKAEVLAVYERCRKMFKNHLEIEPCAETESLARQARSV